MTRPVQVTRVGNHYTIEIGLDVVVTINKEEKESLISQLNIGTGGSPKPIAVLAETAELAKLVHTANKCKADFDEAFRDIITELDILK